ncbi:MAG TPA: hypothetical protein VD866_07265 [Urbifossiella sp.]|nr:hypothetical protein [Urbifossiella sp.]
MSRRFRAPVGNGEVLADPPFAEVPRLVAENRRRLDRADVRIGGLPLRELRALARREVLGGFRSPDDGPLLLAGHQPELSHPGVWVKHFALNGLARKLGGNPVNLIVDTDTLKNPALHFPTFQDHDPRSVHSTSVPFDRTDGEWPYEDRTVRDRPYFTTFAERAAPLWANWGYEPLLPGVWSQVVRQEWEPMIGARFGSTRRDYERYWGCANHELHVSRLSQTDAFRVFASHILSDLPRFREVYNAAIRAYRRANRISSANHPAPELAEGEAPFWVRTGADGRRARATAASDPTQLRPRALTLTLFARVCLGDFFIHGIGGGKYDEVTDAIIRDYFGLEPPAYQVLSATLHLPLPGPPTTADDVDRQARLVRDLNWNPHRHLTAENARRPEVAALVAEHEVLRRVEPPHGAHARRRGWFRALRTVTEQLRPFVGELVPRAEAELERMRAEAAANAVLRRRDYSWVLYPEETLRPFLQRFLDV